jgi:hypothetical protein
MSPENVSHALASPSSKPRLNQLARCSAVPCVTLSGLIRPVVSAWMTQRGLTPSGVSDRGRRARAGCWR